MPDETSSRPYLRELSFELACKKITVSDVAGLSSNEGHIYFGRSDTSKAQLISANAALSADPVQTAFGHLLVVSLGDRNSILA